MFVQAQSKQRFGEIHTPYISLDAILCVEQGHGEVVNVKMTNGEELVVSGEPAKRLWAYVQEHTLR